MKYSFEVTGCQEPKEIDVNNKQYQFIMALIKEIEKAEKNGIIPKKCSIVLTPHGCQISKNFHTLYRIR